MIVFSSDNSSGVHPEVLEAIARANTGRAVGYGDDAWTERAVACLRRHFGADVEVFPVWGGTAANIIGLSAVMEPYHAVLCAETSHLANDECAAPERFLGGKLVGIPTVNGKVSVDTVAARVRGLGVVHHAQPRVLSIAQPTELGTVYTVDEIRALASLCQKRGLLFHVDGARLSNAAVHLDVPLSALTFDAGVDLLSFGGTKNGLMGAEAIVMRPGIGRGTEFHRKQAMQLASKMRFLSAQLEAMLDGDLWHRAASHANAAAARLANGIARLSDVELAYPVESNAVFVRAPAAALEALRAQFRFLIWEPDPARPVARFMCAFDTPDDDVDALVDALSAAPR